MKGLKLLLLTFATLAITACSDDTTDEWHGDFGSIQVPDTRQLSQKIPAGQTAGNSEIFFSTNDAWNSAITDESRAEAPTWVRINPDHGDAAGDYDIRVETDPNTAEESRTAFIEITCGTNSILITITQSGTDGEDTNEPDEPNIGEQVRYWQLHKIVGRDASGSLIAEMEYTYELPAEFSKECRITGFKISAADKNGTLRPVETWQFTYEGDDCIRFSFTREIDGEQPYTQTADGTLYGYFCDVRSGGYELTSTLSGSEIETYGFDCTYGTGSFNSDKLTSISRYNSLTLEPICEKYEWEKDPWGPLEAWDNCSAVIRTLENEPNTETFRQEYGYDYDETTAWSDFIYELEGTPLLNSDPVLLLVAEPDILRGLGFFSSLNNDLFRTVTTRSDDAVTTQTFEYTRQTVAHDAEIATPLIIYPHDPKRRAGERLSIRDSIPPLRPPKLEIRTLRPACAHPATKSEERFLPFLAFRYRCPVRSFRSHLRDNRPFVRLAVLISEFPIIRKKIHLMLFLKKEIRHRSAKISRQSKLTFSLRKKNLSTTKQSEPGRR